ncbi:hypothetical protein ACWF7H_21790 [Peribacillus butanolivorans]|uniref:hypothetical protein n=1 Tax=Peribacillus butanolivorans TaxID=421767 RepID=UPI0036C00C27
MKWRLFLRALFIVSLALTVGCSNKQEHISIQKREGKIYKFEAYKESIEIEKTIKTKEILKNINWENSKMEKDRPKADYIFYFNDEKNEDKIVVYYVWVISGENILKLTKGKHNKYVQLNKADSEIVLNLIQ